MSGSSLIIALPNGRKVGEISIGEIGFPEITYDETWKKEGFPLSPRLPFSTIQHNALETTAFLSNLLPEGNALLTLTEMVQISKTNTVGLIGNLGKDLSGAFNFFFNQIEENSDPVIRYISHDEMIQRVEWMLKGIQDITVWDGKPRLSVAGFQEKLNVFYNNGEFALVDGRLSSNAILKFEVERNACIVANEAFLMKLAKKVIDHVADVEILRFGEYPALLIHRFDRRLNRDNNQMLRRHLIDGCQAIGLLPEKKYQREQGNGRDVKHLTDGASFVKLIRFIREYANVADEIKFIQWAIFNSLVFNFDAHAKNISFFWGKDGAQITPFYDFNCIEPYKNVSDEWAMCYGEQEDGFHKTLSTFNIADWISICEFDPNRVITIINKLCVDIKHNIDDTITEIKVNLNSDEQQHIQLCRTLILQQIDRFEVIAEELKTFDWDLV